MNEPPVKILLCDALPERADLLRRVLEQYFSAEICRVETYEQAQAEAGRSEWVLAMVAHDLPYEHPKGGDILPEHFNLLKESLDMGDRVVRLVRICDENDRELRGVNFPLYDIHIPSPPHTDERRASLISEIERAGGLRSEPPLPRLIWNRKENRALRRQIRALSLLRSLEDGERALATLIARSLECDEVEVEQLGQGKSGARVFRIKPRKGVESLPEYLLKLVEAHGSQGLTNIKMEIRGHQHVAQILNKKDYIRNIARLEKPLFSAFPDDADLRYAVNSDRWYAVRFDFLGGGEFGKFLDLETALTARLEVLQEKTRNTPFEPHSSDIRKLRARLFENILGWLCRNFYCNPSHVSRDKMAIWSFDEKAYDKYASKPPYSLSSDAKEEIHRFLSSPHAAIGRRFFQPDWDRLKDDVEDFIEPKLEKVPPMLRNEMSVALSPAHGDLNSNNVLLWLDEEHPFLIDFPFFQDRGHAMQDLARLEVEIKFALMDRQAESPFKKLQAFDHTYSQLEVWKQCEDYLLDDDWEEKKDLTRRQRCYNNNAEFCLELIKMIRRQVKEVRKKTSEQHTDIPPFTAEYFPPLLYHTLRAISYDSLSLFKRLLAVYSAGKILSQMRS